MPSTIGPYYLTHQNNWWEATGVPGENQRFSAEHWLPPLHVTTSKTIVQLGKLPRRCYLTLLRDKCATLEVKCKWFWPLCHWSSIKHGLGNSPSWLFSKSHYVIYTWQRVRMAQAISTLCLSPLKPRLEWHFMRETSRSDLSCASALSKINAK